MRPSFVFASTLGLFLLIGCGQPEPVATGKKAPNLAPATPAPAVSSNSTPTPTGDATKGGAALTANCSTAGCHGNGARAIGKTDSGKIAAAASKSFHKGLETAFSTNAADIEAYLLTK